MMTGPEVLEALMRRWERGEGGNGFTKEQYDAAMQRLSRTIVEIQACGVTFVGAEDRAVGTDVPWATEGTAAQLFEAEKAAHSAWKSAAERFVEQANKEAS